jgi:hypothetical protein
MASLIKIKGIGETYAQKLSVAGSFAPAGLPNPAAKPLDRQIQREQNSTSRG